MAVVPITPKTEAATAVAVFPSPAKAGFTPPGGSNKPRITNIQAKPFPRPGFIGIPPFKKKINLF
jgi:hypothetical protein